MIVSTPMSMHEADALGNFSITFNGEIYNYLALRAELSKRGYVFKTTSDTEVLLCAYIEWKEKCIHHIRGEFAFVIHDKHAHCLFLARDPVGVKPLFYAIASDGTLVFASTPYAVGCHPLIARHVDVRSVADYVLSALILTNGSLGPHHSFYQGICQFPPGHYGVYNGAGLQLHEYWAPSFIRPYTNNTDEAIDRLRAAITQATIARLPDEVDFAVALSGGIDSSIVASIAQEHCRALDAYSIRFSEGNTKDYEYAASFAKQKKLPLHDVVVTSQEHADGMEALVHMLDEPHDTTRQIGLASVFKAMHAHGKKVALVGEGSDEFNLGYYSIYPGFAAGRDVPPTPQAFADAIRKRIPYAAAFFNPSALSGVVNFEEMIEANIAENYIACDSDDPLDRMQYYYIKRFLPYRLAANDKLGMAHGVEVRVPFCDVDAITASLAIPCAMNVNDGLEKQALRKAFADKLPKDILERCKYPLPENSDSAVQNVISARLSYLIDHANSAVWDILNKETALRILARFEHARDGQSLLLSPRQRPPRDAYLLLSLIVWLQLRT
ncbi:MAG: asparagine synthase (glutamine-hydrolyzing) [Alphaproteobacteria bacterium]|nr:asparagine synthase (glutamine-hydrolyzing) [Alphaproteobacteria bacterium]